MSVGVHFWRWVSLCFFDFADVKWVRVVFVVLWFWISLPINKVAFFPPQLRVCDFVGFEFSNTCDKSVDFDW